MTSVLSTLNPLFEKNQTLTKSIYTSFNRSTREGVKKDSANSLVNTDETESLHYNNDNLVFDSTLGPATVIISSDGNITAKGNLTIGGVFNGTCSNATNAINADHAKSATNADKATNADHATNADNATNATNATKAADADHATNADVAETAVIANNLTDDAKASLQTRFDTRYLQSVPDTLALKDLSVTNQITGSIQSAATSSQADIANGLTDAATKTLQDTFDSRYLSSVPSSLSLTNLTVANTIKGNTQTADDLTTSGKNSLQNTFDSRYVLQTSITNYNPLQAAVVTSPQINISPITAGLEQSKVMTLGSFTIESVTDYSAVKIIGVIDFFYLNMRIKPGNGKSVVETVAGKSPGDQGIVSLFLTSNVGVWDTRCIPFRTAITEIETGKTTTSYALFKGYGSRFRREFNNNETLTLQYYSSNYTEGTISWSPTVSYYRIIFYENK